MVDDPLPNEDGFDMTGAVVQWTLSEDNRAAIRLEVAKALAPNVNPVDYPSQTRVLLDWWVNWITGELDD